MFLPFFVATLLAGVAAQTSTRCWSNKVIDLPSEPHVPVDPAMLPMVLPLIVIGVLVGLSVNMSKMKANVLHERRAFLAGLICHFGFMPFYGFILSVVVPPDDALCNDSTYALGILLPCLMPGGTSSNLFTWLMGGNLELSVALTYMSNVCAIVLIPLYSMIFHSSRFPSEPSMPVLYSTILGVLVITLVSNVGGMALQKSLGRWSSVWLQRVLTAIAVTSFVTDAVLYFNIPGTGLMDNSFITVLVILSYSPVGYVLGFLVSKFVFRTDVVDGLTVAFETGIRYFGLGVVLAPLAFDRYKDPSSVAEIWRITGGTALALNVHYLWQAPTFALVKRRLSGEHADSKDTAAVDAEGYPCDAQEVAAPTSLEPKQTGPWCTFCCCPLTFVIGLALVLVSFIFLHGMAKDITERMYDGMFIDGSGEKSFATFSERQDESCDRGQVATRSSIVVFNTTNAVAYLAGAKPVVKELKPIVYCKLVKDRQVDKAKFDATGVLHHRDYVEHVVSDFGPGVDAKVVVPNPFFAAALAMGIDAALAPLKTPEGFPAFLTLTVGELLGYKGAALYEPILARGNFSLNLLKDGWTSWSGLRVGTPTSKPANAEMPNVVDGMYTTVSWDNATYHCGFDKDCLFQSGYTDKSDIGGCVPDDVCQPSLIHGYSGYYVPTGKFFHLLDVDRPYDYRQWTAKGTEIGMWSNVVSKLFILRNTGEEVFGKIITHRWEVTGMLSRSENCNATPTVGSSCAIPSGLSGTHEYISCLTSMCEDASPLLLAQFTDNKVPSCSAAIGAGLSCNDPLVFGMPAYMFCAEQCCKLPGGKPKRPVVDSPGYDCDSPSDSFWVGATVSMETDLPMYASTPFWLPNPNVAQAAPNRIEWHPLDRVEIVKCDGCVEAADRASELRTVLNYWKETGWAVQVNNALQLSLRMAYPTHSSIYPNAMECLIPVGYVRNQLEVKADVLGNIVTGISVLHMLFPICLIYGILFLLLPLFCAYDKTYGSRNGQQLASTRKSAPQKESEGEVSRLGSGTRVQL